MQSKRKRKTVLVILLITALLYACSRDKEKSADSTEDQLDRSTAVALIGDSGLSRDEVLAYIKLRSHRGDASQVLDQALKELTIAELMYQEALHRGLHKRPEIKQAMRQLLGQQLMKEQVTDPVLKRHIPEEELRHYYNEHLDRYVRPKQIRLADIFIAAPATNDPEKIARQKEKASQIFQKAQLLEKERFGFSRLVREYSDKNPHYKLGDTGYFDRNGQPAGIAEELVEAGFALPANGALTDHLIQTAAGFHIIKRVAEREAFSRDFGSITMELEQGIRKEELAKKRDALITSLKKNSRVKIQDDVFAGTLQEIEGNKKKYGILDTNTQNTIPVLPKE